MNNISSFFGKIFKKISDDAKDKKEIILVLEQRIHNKIDEQAVTIQDSVITVATHPVIKQELLLHKEAILKEINQKIETKITDLR